MLTAKLYHNISCSHATTHRRRVLSVVLARLLLPLAILTAPLIASAAPKLEVQVIEATTSGNTLDPALKQMGSLLKRSFKKYKSFKLLSKNTHTPPKNETFTLPLEAGLDAKLMLKLKPNGVDLKTTVGRKRGSTRAGYGELFFQAFKWKSKVFILAITAHK